MSDDLFKDCDCGDCGDCDCGDCDCDCDCFDCDCNCDDCLPGNNFIIICCCFPPPVNDANKTNRTEPDCCCCCWERRHYSPRRRRREKKNRRKKKGFCCWRLWCCCFVRREPSPPPSPPRPGPDELPPRYRRDGRYPMPDDLDSYMNDRWDRHHELDMPPRGYMSGGKYPMPGEMRMYRDEYYGRGDRRKEYRSGGRYGNHEVERDARSKDYYSRRDGRDERGTNSRDDEAERKKLGMDKLEKEASSTVSHDLRRNEENTISTAQDVPPTSHHVSYHGHDHRKEIPDELVISPLDSIKYGELDSPPHYRASGSEEPLDPPHPGHNLPYRWSGKQSEH